ncbi:hypothetical protein JHD48_09965, partial [Sulfurimonas sp. SAG-AH-194-I05]
KMFIVGLLTVVGLSANNNDTKQIVVKKSSANIEYTKEEASNINLQCGTNLKKGTYTEYFESGKLKIFRVISE